MTGKDPKDMTASELLRKAAADGDSESSMWSPLEELFHLIGISVTEGQEEVFTALADKIDAELAQARELSLLHGAAIWAKANGWPDIREGEGFDEWLDRCALPRPRFEDGEPVDMEDFGDPESDDFAWYTVSDSGDWTIYAPAISLDPIEGDISERVKRPAPEVLGADGLPIEVGETVWLDGEHAHWAGFVTLGSGDRCGLVGVDPHDSLKVRYVNDPRSGMVCFANAVSAGCPASWLTHTSPDTQERIDSDAQKSMVEYWECATEGCLECPAKVDGRKPCERYGTNVPFENCTAAMMLDLLRRQRELDARKGGAE